MELFFVRHGETVWNRAKRLQGRLDSPLTLRGVQLALGYGERLAAHLGDRAREAEIHASPLGRTRQTAAILADLLGCRQPVQEEERLIEHDVGAFSGRSWAEIERDEGVAAASFRDWHARPPGGETRHEMRLRAADWIETRPRGRPLIVVSHGGLSRAFRAAFLELSERDAMALPPHDHGRFFQLFEGPPRHMEEIESPAGPAVPEAALG